MALAELSTGSQARQASGAAAQAAVAPVEGLHCSSAARCAAMLGCLLPGWDSLPAFYLLVQITLHWPFCCTSVASALTLSR